MNIKKMILHNAIVVEIRIALNQLIHPVNPVKGFEYLHQRYTELRRSFFAGVVLEKSDKFLLTIHPYFSRLFEKELDGDTIYLGRLRRGEPTT